MRSAILALPLLAISVPVAAQSMNGMNMPGMQMPGMKMGPKPVAKPKAKGRQLAKATPGRRGASSRARQPARRVAPAKKASMSGMKMGQSPAARSEPGMAGMPGMDMGQSTTGAAPAQPGQGSAMSTMPGMKMEQGRQAVPMQGMNMSQPMPGQDMGDMKMGPAGTTKPVTGNAPAPPPPTDHAADRIYGADAMQGSRAGLRTEQGGQTFYMVLFNLAEVQVRNDRDSYRWDGEAWYGGDLNRSVAKTEGEGAFRGGVDSAEVQALYSRTIGPYWNLQGGVRYDFKPSPSRTYATVGIEGLAPNNFELNGALFLSDKGDLLSRAEGYYDQRITQRVILQPRAEVNLSAQNVPADRYGTGVVDGELGLRLRYEVRREFAPYVGVSWQRQFGDTARFSRAQGTSTGGFSFVAGVRAWL